MKKINFKDLGGQILVNNYYTNCVRECCITEKNRLNPQTKDVYTIFFHKNHSNYKIRTIYQDFCEVIYGN